MFWIPSPWCSRSSAPPLFVNAVVPAHPCDELTVQLQEDVLEHLVMYIRHHGVDATSLLTRRPYGSESGTWRMGSSGLVQKLPAGAIVAQEVDDADSASKPKRFKCVECAVHDTHTKVQSTLLFIAPAPITSGSPDRSASGSESPIRQLESDG